MFDNRIGRGGNDAPANVVIAGCGPRPAARRIFFRRHHFAKCALIAAAGRFRHQGYGRNTYSTGIHALVNMFDAAETIDGVGRRST